MPTNSHQRSHAKHPFVGTWHITAMELWDYDYVNMERQAFVEIDPDNLGSFQFGLVRGQLDGYLETLEETPEVEPSGRRLASLPLGSVRFAFTWDGFDEMDEVSGSGWMRLTSAREAAGVIKVHLGDHSTFRAHRARAGRAG
jgi:hypothetical protein